MPWCFLPQVLCFEPVSFPLLITVPTSLAAFDFDFEARTLPAEWLVRCRLHSMLYIKVRRFCIYADIEPAART